jgi:curli biogenesis system outer membrane secretion channel CsgG
MPTPRLRQALRATLLATTLLAAAPVHAETPAPQPPAYQGLRKTIAVDPFQTPDSIVGGAGTSEGLTTLLTDALTHDGRFVVVERDAMDSIATEQQLGAQHSTTVETAAQAGHLIGANFIVRAAVTKFETQAGASSISVYGVGLSSSHAVVGVALRVIDTTTGQVVATSKGEATAAAHGVSLSYVFNNGQSASFGEQRQTPLGEAAEKAIDQAVAGIATGLEHAPWSALVVERADGRVYINAGANENLEPGALLHVARKDHDLTDPSTGEVLETIKDDVGDVRVTEVREKISIAEVVSGAPVRGDVLTVR